MNLGVVGVRYRVGDIIVFRFSSHQCLVLGFFLGDLVMSQDGTVVEVSKSV